MVFAGFKRPLRSIRYGPYVPARVPLVRVAWDVLKQIKSIWWMPWHREAMKDVALCDKLRGGESTL